MLDLAVIGAGPCGLAVGVAAKRARLTCSLFDKGPVASSLMRYPLYMTFFSTPDKLEIGVPFVTAGDKPTRREALTYYRKVAEHFELDVRQYHSVFRVTQVRDGFELVAQHPGSAEPETIRSRHCVFPGRIYRTYRTSLWSRIPTGSSAWSWWAGATARSRRRWSCAGSAHAS